MPVFLFSCMKSKKELVVGINPNFPPFVYLGGVSGYEIVGFDIEIAKEIAKDQGKELKLVRIQADDDFIVALKNNEIDMAISGIPITEPHKELVDFSRSYYALSIMVLSRADDNTFDSILTKEQLGKEKKIAVVGGTKSAQAAKIIAGEENIIEVESLENASNLLKSKRIDAIMTHKQASRVFVEKYNNVKIVPIDYFDTVLFAVAVKKDSQLVDNINETIARIINSGLYAELIDEYISSFTLNIK